VTPVVVLLLLPRIKDRNLEPRDAITFEDVEHEIFALLYNIEKFCI
jgi:hypothetical protein